MTPLPPQPSENSPTPILGPDRVCLWAALLLAATLIWGRPGPPLLRGTDAAVYATVAQEMAAQPLSNWANPTLEDAPFYEHPPGMMWLLAAGFRLGGATPNVAITVARLLASGMVWGVAAVAARLSGLWGAAGAVLGLCLFSGFYAESQNPMLELPLALGLIVGVWGLLVLGDPQASRRAQSGGAIAAALGFTWAFWAKGPPALIGAPLALVIALQGSKRVRPRRIAWGVVGIVACTSASVLLFGMWRTALELPPFFATYFKLQLWPSITQGRHHPVPSWGYYLPLVWRWYAPWVVAAPAAILFAYRGRRERPGAWAMALLGGVWAVGVVLAFSAARQKYQWYLHAALPGFALSLGAGLAALPPSGHKALRRPLTFACGVAAVALGALGYAQPAVLQPRTQPLTQLQTLPYPDDLPGLTVRRIAMCTGPWGWRERYVARFVRHATLVPCAARADLTLSSRGWAVKPPTPG